MGMHLDSRFNFDAMLSVLWRTRLGSDFPGGARFEFALFVHQWDRARFGRALLKVGDFGHFGQSVAGYLFSSLSLGLDVNAVGSIAYSQTVASVGFQFVVGVKTL